MKHQRLPGGIVVAVVATLVLAASPDTFASDEDLARDNADVALDSDAGKEAGEHDHGKGGGCKMHGKKAKMEGKEKGCKKMQKKQKRMQMKKQTRARHENGEEDESE